MAAEVQNIPDPIFYSNIQTTAVSLDIVFRWNIKNIIHLQIFIAEKVSKLVLVCFENSKYVTMMVLNQIVLGNFHFAPTAKFRNVSTVILR